MKIYECYSVSDITQVKRTHFCHKSKCNPCYHGFYVAKNWATITFKAHGWSSALEAHQN